MELTLKNEKNWKFWFFEEKYQEFNRKLRKNSSFQKNFRGRSACRASRRNSVRILHVEAKKTDNFNFFEKYNFFIPEAFKFVFWLIFQLFIDFQWLVEQDVSSSTRRVIRCQGKFENSSLQHIYTGNCLKIEINVFFYIQI